MVAVVLTLVIAFLIGGTVWLTVGARLPFKEDKDLNEILNLAAYVGIAVLPVFLVVFFLLDRN